MLSSVPLEAALCRSLWRGEPRSSSVKWGRTFSMRAIRTEPEDAVCAGAGAQNSRTARRAMFTRTPPGGSRDEGPVVDLDPRPARGLAAPRQQGDPVRDD